MKIIIQAGGKGTRLEGLTRNKPKCLVPVQNRPLLFHAFEQFPQDEFIVIADYKADVLEKYLQTFAKGKYNYRLIHTHYPGTIGGLQEALSYIGDKEPFLLMWCDILLPPPNTLPWPKPDANYVGIAQDFECRWSFKDGQFIHAPSAKDGVAGVFLFQDKTCLHDLPSEGAFVPWLQKQQIPFRTFGLHGTKEIGTLLAYTENTQSKYRCRPFNDIKFEPNNLVIKTPRTAQGEAIAQKEQHWYQKVSSLHYPFIPDIQGYDPLVMKKVDGRNIFEYDFLTYTQKEIILTKLVEMLKELHALSPAIPAVKEDVQATYLTKTFARLDSVKDLIPFANDEFIKINGHYYHNPFFEKQAMETLTAQYMPQQFNLIHGDCTFSNLMFDTFRMQPVMIDPRGYFGNTLLYGDADYDWAKLYYSLAGNYDQFNLHKFTLDIRENNVEITIKSNGWEDMQEAFFEQIAPASRRKIKFLHALIWLSLTSYAWEDYDSICGAFYNGTLLLENAL